MLLYYAGDVFNYFYVFGCQKFDIASVTADKLDFESSFSLTMQQNTICDVSDHTSLVTSHNLPLSHLVSLCFTPSFFHYYIDSYRIAIVLLSSRLCKFSVS